MSNNNWRKSRKPNAGATGARAVGTDLNRNFDFQWGTGGSSPLPSSDSYKGAEPFDNVESKALADYWNGKYPSTCNNTPTLLPYLPTFVVN